MKRILIYSIIILGILILILNLIINTFNRAMIAVSYFLINTSHIMDD